MTTFTPLVDAESGIRNWLASQFSSPTYRVVTELPANLANEVPLIQVSRFGGADRNIVLDDPNMDVDTFDGPHDDKTARENARHLGGLVRSALLLHLPGQIITSGSERGVVTAVTTISAPRWVPYDNTNLRRFVASYRITIHSIPA